MQVGCCIRRTLASFGTVTAVALIAATGFAGNEPINHSDKDASAATSRMTSSESTKTTKEAFYAKQGNPSPLANSQADVPATVINNEKTEVFTVPGFARGASNPGADSCAMATDLDADLTAGAGSVIITGDTTGGTYIVDPTINTELPLASCAGAFGGFVGNAGKWYSLTGTGNPFVFDGCKVGTTFDTTFSVFTGDCMTGLTCAGGNDDACGTGGPAANFASTGSFNTALGTTYYILIHSGDDGTGTPAPEGLYDFTISEGMIVSVDCTMADAVESDPMCVGSANPGDDINGGCNAGGTPGVDFDELVIGQNCGIISTESVGGSRDLDWYTITIPAGPDVEVTLAATGTTAFNFFAVTFDGVEGTVNCAGALAVVPFGDAGVTSSPDGSTVTGTACLGPGQYVVVMGNTDFASFDCGVNETEYSIVMTQQACPVEACCLGDGTCTDLTNPACLTMGGQIFAGETCASLAAANMGASCIGYCCLLDGTVDDTLNADDCDTLITGGSARSFLGYNLTAQEQMDAFCPVTPDNITCDLADAVMTDGTPVAGNTAASTFVPTSAAGLPGIGCGFAYTDATALWYTFTGTGNDVTVSTDDIGSDYDTRIWIFCGTDSVMPPMSACECLFCVDGDDDGGTGLLSEITVGTESGSTYYVLVGGFGTSVGNFVLTVTDDAMSPSMDPVGCALCDVDNSMAAFVEINEDCVSALDEGNNGCDDAGATGTTFTAEELFIGDVVGGNIGARAGVADSDWYVLNQDSGNPEEQMTITLTSEAPVVMTLFNYLGNTGDPQSDAAAGANCDNVDLAGFVLASEVTGNCDAPAVIEVCLSEGQWFLVLDGGQTVDACSKDEYQLTLTSSGACVTGVCCASDGTCTDGVTESTCTLTIGGAFTAGLGCMDVTCLGACCTQALVPGDANDCAATDFDSCLADPNFLVWNGLETTCADMDVDCGTRPINDECEGAIALTTDGMTTGSATVGTNNLDNSTWYSFVGTGNTVSIELCTSVADGDDANGDLDTAMNIFCQGCDEQRFIGGGDNDACPGGNQEIVTLCTEAGTDYLVEVLAFLGESGTINVTVTDDGVPCASAPDCSPLGACCTDSMSNACVETTQDDCEGTLMGCFLEGAACGFEGYAIDQQPAMPLTEIGPSSTPLAQTAAGIAALVDDEAFAEVLMPFDFNYFGQFFPAGTTLYVCVNGFATFEDLNGFTGNLFTNQEAPTATAPNNTLAPEWDDFITNGAAGNGLFAAAVDTNADTFDDQLIIEWNCSLFGGSNNILFQLVLNDDDTIEFRYGSTGGFGASPSVGLENVDGTNGTNVLGTLGTIAADDRIVLTFEDPADACPTMACDVTTGACCTDGVCSIETEADCLMGGGLYGSDGTTCMDFTCNDCSADFDNDGDVDLGDFGVFGAAFNSMTGDANYNAAADFDNDGDVDLGDFGVFGAQFNRADCHGLFPVGP